MLSTKFILAEVPTLTIQKAKVYIPLKKNSIFELQLEVENSLD
jgi:hypothetical protein